MSDKNNYCVAEILNPTANRYTGKCECRLVCDPVSKIPIMLEKPEAMFLAQKLTFNACYDKLSNAYPAMVIKFDEPCTGPMTDIFLPYKIVSKHFRKFIDSKCCFEDITPVGQDDHFSIYKSPELQRFDEDAVPSHYMLHTSDSEPVKSVADDVLVPTKSAYITNVMRKNKSFIVTENEKMYYIGMLLHTEDIGGITERTVGNHYINDTVKLINEGKIDAYITRELNKDNKLLFIPTFHTIDNLFQFRMFRTASYEFVKLGINADNEVEICEYTGIMELFDVFRNIVIGESSITDFIRGE